MYLPEYQGADLRLAYCYRAYLRWRTHCGRAYAPLAQLSQPTLHQRVDRFGLHVLECESDTTEVRCLVSLEPHETLAACASKLKGQTSRWLREALRLDRPDDLLSKGYFACTTGNSTAAQVHQYLEQQGEHHGYDRRVLPPVYVETFPWTAADEARVRANHSWTLVQWHLVLSVWRRRGVFAAPEGKAVAAEWRRLQASARFVVRKVSFLPDHVHVAVRAHPSVAPAEVVLRLLNAGQQLMVERFGGELVRAGVERHWQPSAYIGSYGDLASAQIRQYLHNWKIQREQGG